MNVLEIRNTLLTYWSTNYHTTPTLYTNSSQPDTLTQNPFVMFEIEYTNSKTVGTGEPDGTLTRHRGFIAVTVNVPLKSSDLYAYTIAKEVLELLERKRINGVSTYAGHIDDERINGEHFQMVLLIPFVSTIGG